MPGAACVHLQLMSDAPKPAVEEQVAKRQMVQCRQPGCNEMMPDDQRPAHEQACCHRMVQCGEEDCDGVCTLFGPTLCLAGQSLADGDGTGAGLNDEELVLRMYTNTHDLAAPVYAASICQEEFTALLRTVRPWHFSGDRAPFI